MPPIDMTDPTRIHVVLDGHLDELLQVLTAALKVTQSTRRRTWTWLTPEQVTEIRRRAAAGESRRSLAAEFGRTTDSISNVVEGKTWKDVSQPVEKTDDQSLAG